MYASGDTVYGQFAFTTRHSAGTHEGVLDKKGDHVKMTQGQNAFTVTCGLDVDMF